jgi:hypothetical protein
LLQYNAAMARQERNPGGSINKKRAPKVQIPQAEVDLKIPALDVLNPAQDVLSPKAQETECKHHWIIEPPSGETSMGRCKLCGAARGFRNYIEAPTDGYKKSPKKAVEHSVEE